MRLAASNRHPPSGAWIAEARPLHTAAGEIEHIVDWIGDASVVLLGEASHGTHDFYELRARLTRRLIERKGFAAVAIEGDWPDAYQVNRFVNGRAGTHANEALAGFRRFPTWMWRNTVVAEFVAWLRTWNAAQRSGRRTGFYGLDLYSLHASMRAVIDYLAARDPAAARAARAAYACFEQFGEEPDAYAWASGRLEQGNCEEQVAHQLLELHRRRADLLRRDGSLGEEEFFHAEQNARLARNAERYYRTMFHGRVSSWNVRDEHMGETLEELRDHLQRRRGDAKVIVWAHNSHLGDARATEMGERGELNLGQLARERYGAEVRSIGFTTSLGTVMAASDWGAEAEVKDVRPPLAGSYEAIFHAAGLPAFFLPLGAGSAAASDLAGPLLERAIGVIYRPETERQSHYFRTRLPAQFDAVIHLDETRALTPLEIAQPVLAGEPPETYPEGT